MNLEKTPKKGNPAKIGHEEFFKYSLPQGNDRRIRFHGKKIERETIYFKIKDLINEGVTSTNELSAR
ncbi:MAG: hypothetical protein ACREAN_08845, partial [Nitrosopumilaceae archaeon]